MAELVVAEQAVAPGDPFGGGDLGSLPLLLERTDVSTRLFLSKNSGFMEVVEKLLGHLQ